MKKKKDQMKDADQLRTQQRFIFPTSAPQQTLEPRVSRAVFVPSQ